MVDCRWKIHKSKVEAEVCLQEKNVEAISKMQGPVYELESFPQGVYLLRGYNRCKLEGEKDLRFHYLFPQLESERCYNILKKLLPERTLFLSVFGPWWDKEYVISLGKK